MNEYNDQKFYEYYKDFFEGTESSLDLSDMPPNLPLPEELDGEDVYDVLMLFRDEKTALDWVKTVYPQSLEKTKLDLTDRVCGVSASVYDNDRELYIITQIRNGGFILWEGY